MRRFRTFGVLAILVLGVGTFAATGGIDLIRSWFATVTVNGQVVHTGEVVPDENGQATITLPEGSLQPGENQVGVTLKGDPGAGPQTVTVTATGGENGVTIQTQQQPGASAEQKQK